MDYTSIKQYDDALHKLDIATQLSLDSIWYDWVQECILINSTGYTYNLTETSNNS